MRRFLTLVFMLCLAVPAGISISGCTRNPAGNYCYGLGYGIKNTEVVSVVLQPQSTGISLAFGQTQQIQQPAAFTCTGSGASVNANNYVYGTSNNKLVDISPAGNICAGTWNRNTGGGIADYTYCTAPATLPNTDSLPYSVAYITASINSVTSNPVKVFVHKQVSSIALDGPDKCVSQSQTAALDAQACYSSGGTQYLFCKPAGITNSSQYACPMAPGVTSVPTCAAALGYLSYSVSTSTVGTINTNTNVITANLPGTTAITATISGTGASAGYFSTCPPQSISLTTASGGTSATVTKGVTQNLTTTILDTNNVTITGLSLDYQSTNPIDISVGSTGAITATYPGVASIYAVCQPQTCDPAPLNELGLNGTGLSLASNAVNITTPGTISDYAWFAAPGTSQYFVPYSLLTGALGSNVRLPYVPNSMVMDRTGTNLIFGSQHELMIYSTVNNSITKQDASVPGVVLAVSPDNSQVLINDQVHQLFYLYNVSAGGYTTQNGLGNAAAWTPDSKTLYITDNAALNNPPYITGHTDTLYVYSQATAKWSTYSLPPSPLPAGAIPANSVNGATLPLNSIVSQTMQTPAVTIPGVGAYLRGSTTVAHTWCPVGTVSTSAGAAITSYYPGPDLGAGDSQAVESDVLAATTDGKHILGATISGANAITLSDIGIILPTQTTINSAAVPVACPVTTNGTTGVQTLGPLAFNHTTPAYTQSTVTASASALTQLVASPVSNLAFVLYNGSSANAQLPYYIPGSSAAGSVGYVTLSGASSITAPLAGAFTPDDSSFLVSTAGDNKIHFIAIPSNPAATAPTDTQQISPNLPACSPVSAGGLDAGCVYSGSGSVVPTTAIAIVPRSTT